MFLIRINFPVMLLEGDFLPLSCGETSHRSWIVFSPTKQAIYCFPCRLFSHTINSPAHLQLSFAAHGGCGADKKWKKLWDRIPGHEKSDAHKSCYLRWRQLQRRLENDSGINVIIEESVSSDVAKWKKLLSWIIDVVIFLGQRGLTFRESWARMGDVDNGNFIGLLEVLAHYDLIMEDKEANDCKRTTCHQNRKTMFINLCAARLRKCILDERELANTTQLWLMLRQIPAI